MYDTQKVENAAWVKSDNAGCRSVKNNEIIKHTTVKDLWLQDTKLQVSTDTRAPLEKGGRREEATTIKNTTARNGRLSECRVNHSRMKTSGVTLELRVGS